MNAVRGENKDIAPLNRPFPVIDRKIALNAECPREIALLPGNAHTMIVRQPLDMPVPQKINPGIAHVKDMRHGGLEHRAGKGADHAAPFFGQRFALAVHPAVGCGQDALHARLDRPGGVRREIIVEEAPDAGFACFLGGLARTHAIGDRHGNALRCEKRLLGQQHAIGIVIAALAASDGMLPDRYGDFAGRAAQHGCQATSIMVTVPSGISSAMCPLGFSTNI